MRSSWLACLVILGVVASAQAQPVLSFKSRELQEGNSSLTKLTAVLAVGEASGELSYRYGIDLPAGRGVTPEVALECAIALERTLAGRPEIAKPGGPETMAWVANELGRRPENWIPANGMSGATTMMQSSGNGQRAIIYGWKIGERFGHFFNAIKQGDKVNYIDGQSGKAAVTTGYDVINAR